MGFKTRVRLFAKVLYALALGGMTAEILFRRLVRNQIPTQVPAALVYGVLLADCFLLFLFFRPTAGPSTKTERN